MKRLLAVTLVLLLAGCDLQHSGCPSDLPQSPDDTSGVKSAIRTCN